MNVGKYFEQKMKMKARLLTAEGRSQTYINGFADGMKFLSDTIEEIQELEMREKTDRIKEKLERSDFKVLLGGDAKE